MLRDGQDGQDGEILVPESCAQSCHVFSLASPSRSDDVLATRETPVQLQGADPAEIYMSQSGHVISVYAARRRLVDSPILSGKTMNHLSQRGNPSNPFIEVVVH